MIVYGVVSPLRSLNLRLDPNTHALVMATALIVSVAFAIFAMNVLAAMLTWFPV
jgi:hypothetical protein